MTALFGAAVLGLLPLPSRASSESGTSHGGGWPTAGDAAQPIGPPHAIFQRVATREELARLRREHETVTADVTRQ